MVLNCSADRISMKWKLPQYSGKDYLVLSFFVGPFAISINSLMLGARYFTDYRVFFIATAAAAIDYSAGFTCCSAVGVLLKRYFRGEEGIGRRLLVMILFFLIIVVIFLEILFQGYKFIPFFQYTFHKTAFVWSLIGTGISSIFITFLLEGISRYEIWKNKKKENEQLSKANRQSRLLGLKSQVNPHFLFNSLNSLSSLIYEDEEKAEKFLDEMSKVYRYMLRNEDCKKVMLITELKFVESYYYLLKARYGDGLRITMNISHDVLHKWLPPLSLQVIIENAFTQNAMTKDQPLNIHIERGAYGIVVRNNVQPKLVDKNREIESGIDNLVTRYALLHQSKIIIQDTAKERIIHLPLFDCKMEEEEA
jgi:two-component system, LytTR family, sensor kinase